ncbi:DEP domain-containing protein 1B-like isoform X1 [Erpetoichthys calabaricus]|uniref:DEP domain-containing protein 1B-like isoform X1 n=1 Tax=Erpetoichthys calabaricus TaxID=27687 RepID=UPI002234D9B4|nr:DEP domain-containing protein 1B-like isoform X1 [Erpetoichthys calabaricus]
MSFPESRIVTPGPYRATKLWNEVTKFFRAGMPLKNHRHNFRRYGNCFTASAAVDWLHELLKNNSNFGPEVTRQQTVQLLRKFLKNHIIEDIKGKWGTENLEDNSQLYRFPSTSPLKTLPNPPSNVKKRSQYGSIKDKDGFLRISQLYKRNSKKFENEQQENVQPGEQDDVKMLETEHVHSRDVTQEDIDEIWRNITLVHLQKTLGLPSLLHLLDPAFVNPHHIIYNMTNVNKHGVVTLQDKSGDLPHWVLSAMKCLANWPKYESSEPSYPGFERDVFKSVSDYFLNLTEPLLTFEFYELFVNILVLCGYVMTPKIRKGKRKIEDESYCHQPAKTAHLNEINPFKSTECLLLSLACKESLEEPQSPQNKGLEESARTIKRVLPKGSAKALDHFVLASRRASSINDLRGKHPSLSRVRMLSKSWSNSCSLEGLLDVPKEGAFISNQTTFKPEESSLPCLITAINKTVEMTSYRIYPKQSSQKFNNQEGTAIAAPSEIGEPRTKPNRFCRNHSSPALQSGKQPKMSRSVSAGSGVGFAHHQEEYGSYSSLSIPIAPDVNKSNCSLNKLQRSPSRSSLMVSKPQEYNHFNCPNRRWKSTLELSKSATSAAVLPLPNFAHPHTADESLLQPPLERVAIEALQLCTLFLPPANRRRLQLLMRMMSRMSENVDMPRLHDAIGTRTLMIHTFSHCILCCEEEVDLDELLATRLVSFFMDHHREVLQIPVYLQNAVLDYIDYLRKVKITYPSGNASATLPSYSFCKQISPQEFEQQKVSASQVAIAELLESLIKEKNISVKDKKKKLKQFQKEYPEIYQSRFPTTESEAKLFDEKPKIKQPLLISLKKTKILGAQN